MAMDVEQQTLFSEPNPTQDPGPDVSTGMGMEPQLDSAATFAHACAGAEQDLQ